MHYRDLENFDNELKEQKILEFEKDHKRHLIELEKLKNARKELELESKQQFLKGLRPFTLSPTLLFNHQHYFLITNITFLSPTFFEYHQHYFFITNIF